MDKLLIVCWGITEISAAVLLVKGISGWSQIFGFSSFHGLTILFTYMIFRAFIGRDIQLRKQVMCNAFLFFLMVVSVIPSIGPAVSLFIILFLRYCFVVSIRTESFKLVNHDVLIDLQKKLESRTIPITEALLIRQLSRDDALRMVLVIDEMDWTATKSGILRYIIRLGPYQNIVLLAIDIFKKKTDSILSEIGTLESAKNPDHERLRVLSNLYHEICYLDLCEPVMKQIYLNKASDYAVRAFNSGGNAEDDALLAVRYLLETGRVNDANTIYLENQKKGQYNIPKWLPYELELSVRRTDMKLFENLFPTIKAGGGVYVPEKVKKAAETWRKVLTSAWL